MNVVLEVGTKNYVDDLLSIKKSLSHIGGATNLGSKKTRLKFHPEVLGATQSRVHLAG